MYRHGHITGLFLDMCAAMFHLGEGNHVSLMLNDRYGPQLGEVGVSGRNHTSQ